MHPFESVTEPLLAWFASSARSMPWRDDPTPYHVWISEIMLQQTRVSAVIPYYERFLEALPDVAALAACDDEKLMKLWEGLGYYSRARNLKKAALRISEEFGGVFPSDYVSVRSLPGIGDYTAGAILSIAFGQPEPAVDGNVLRIVARITGDESDIMAESTRAACRDLIRACMPKGQTSAYTQALMELGATVCLPNGAPLCDCCPVRSFCVALRENRIGQLPVKTPSKPRRIESRTVYFLLFGNKVALRRRPKKGLLSGLWEFPNELSDAPSPFGDSFACAAPFFGEGKHIFSHIEWHMTSLVCRTDSPRLPEGYVWADLDELRDVYAVPAAFRDFMPALSAALSES